MSRKGHINGKRVAGTHTTVTPDAQKVVDALMCKDCPDQGFRVSAGVIKQAGNGQFHLKVDFDKIGDTVVGLKLTVRGTRTVQTLRICGSHKLHEVKKYLEKTFATA